MAKKQTKDETKIITKLIEKVAAQARKETDAVPESELTQPIKWPVNCLVGPGLEGAIACESKIGYVNGSKGWLIYRGYDIFDLCAHSNFEEVSYLLLHGNLPTKSQLDLFNKSLIYYRRIPETVRLLMSFPIEKMNAMSCMRLGINLLRQVWTLTDRDDYQPSTGFIGADEDSIPMETMPMGEKKAIYEFKKRVSRGKRDQHSGMPIGHQASYHLISASASIAAAVCRLRQGHLPIEPDPDLSHAANFLYMMTGKRPTKVQERIMDIALILHADHGINASTFASLVVASTLSDVYWAVGSGIAALNGPLHGGANEQVLHMLREIGAVSNVDKWFKDARTKKKKIMGFGHRVYKAYDPRARVLGPLARYLVENSGDEEALGLFRIAEKLEDRVVETLGSEKKIFPNVDFYSGLVYSCLGIPVELFTPIFAVSRVAGWTARVQEYLENNRIFRPRAMYVGAFDRKYTPIDKR